MVKVLSLALALFLTGCSYNSMLCPDFPKPTQSVLDELKALNNSEVDSWVVELYKLNQKLQVCKGE